MINGAGKTVLKTYTVDLSKPDEELEARAPWYGTDTAVPYFVACLKRRPQTHQRLCSLWTSTAVSGA